MYHYFCHKSRLSKTGCMAVGGFFHTETVPIQLRLSRLIYFYIKIQHLDRWMPSDLHFSKTAFVLHLTVTFSYPTLHIILSADGTSHLLTKGCEE